MLQRLLFLAQNSSDDINRWLGENPLVLGSLALILGIVLAGYGAYELKTGVSRDKRGREIEGGLGKASSIVRLVAGVAIILFGVYKIVAG